MKNNRKRGLGSGGNSKRPYEKPRIIEERKLEALAVVCGGLFDQKQTLGQYNGQGYCTSLFS